MADAGKDIMKELGQCAHAVGMQGNMYEISNFMAEFGSEAALTVLNEIREVRQKALDQGRQPKQGRWLWDAKVAVIRREKAKEERKEFEFREYNKLIQEQKEERKRIEKRGFDPLNFWDRHKQLVEPLKKGVSVMPGVEISLEEQERLGRVGLYVFFLSRSDDILQELESEFKNGKIDEPTYQKRKVDFGNIFGKGIETNGLSMAGAIG